MIALLRFGIEGDHEMNETNIHITTDAQIVVHTYEDHTEIIIGGDAKTERAIQPSGKDPERVCPRCHHKSHPVHRYCPDCGFDIDGFYSKYLGKNSKEGENK